MQIYQHTLRIIVAFCCIVFVFETKVNAQNSHYSFYDNNNLNIKSTDYRRVVSIVDSLLVHAYPFHKDNDERHSFDIVDSVFAGTFMDDNLKDLFEKFYNYRIKKVSNDIGLKLTGYYNYNFQPGFSDEEELYYRERAYVGIDWNLLDNGLLGNRVKVEKMKVDMEVNKLEKEREMARENFVYRYNYITFIFNRLKLQLIERRLDVLDGLGKIAIELFYKRSITWEDVLKIKEKINRLELENRDFYDYNYYNEWGFDIYPENFLELKKMPYLDINLVEMMTSYEVDNRDSVLLALKIKQVEKKYNALSGVMLKPFVRYNYQKGLENHERYFGSAGLSAGIPLNFGPHRNRIIEAEKELVKAEEKEGVFFRKSDLLKLYHQYQSKKFQFVSLYFKKARFNERLRKGNVAMVSDNPTFSPLTLLADLDEKMAVEMEITDLLKTQYLTVLQIQELLNGVKVSSFVANMEVEELVRRYSGKRTVFMEFDSSNNFDNELILNEFKLNEITEVVLSMGDNYQKEKLDSLLKSASASNISVFNLIGDSNAMFYSKEEFDLRLRKVLKHKFSGIHIDVKSSDLEVWKERREKYLTVLVELFERTNKFTHKHNLDFSVSIPDSLPVKYIKLIYKFADKVMVKVYDTTDSETIVKRIEDEFSVSSKRSVLVVRPIDFSSRTELESVLNKVMDNSGVKNIALHDLPGLRELEKSGYSFQSRNTLRRMKNRDKKYMYRIQIAASRKEIPTEEMKKFKGVSENVTVFFRDGYYKYTILAFNMYEDALKTLYDIRRKKGLEGSFLFKAAN